MKEIEKLNPKCHRGRGIAYVSTGHLLPCCWCDSLNPKYKNQFMELGFFFEDLKLENNDKIEDILLSDVWINFHEILLEKPQEAPDICKKKCSYDAGDGLFLNE